MEFYVCTARVCQGRKNTGSVNLTAEGMDTITNLILHGYINRKVCVITLKQFPGGDASAAPSVEKNYDNKRNQPHARHKKWKKGESKKYIKVLEDFFDDFVSICHPKSEEHLLHLLRALLHGIHTVFPPPSVAKYSSPDPI